MWFWEFFQTDLLINFFIRLRRAEAFTWENFAQEKRNLTSATAQKRDPALPG